MPQPFFPLPQRSVVWPLVCGNICCYLQPYTITYFVPQQSALWPSECGNMCAVTHGNTLQHICASAVSGMNVRVWNLVWSYTTANFVPQQSAVWVSVFGNMCTASYGHTLQHFVRAVTFQGQGQSPPTGKRERKKKHRWAKQVKLLQTSRSSPSSEMDTNASFLHFVFSLWKNYILLIRSSDNSSFLPCSTEDLWVQQLNTVLWHLGMLCIQIL